MASLVAASSVFWPLQALGILKGDATSSSYVANEKAPKKETTIIWRLCGPLLLARVLLIAIYVAPFQVRVLILQLKNGGRMIEVRVSKHTETPLNRLTILPCCFAWHVF